MLRGLISLLVLVLVATGPARVIAGGCQHGNAHAPVRASQLTDAGHPCCHDHQAPCESNASDHCQADCGCGCQDLAHATGLVSSRLTGLPPMAAATVGQPPAKSPLVRPFAPPLRPPSDA